MKAKFEEFNDGIVGIYSENEDGRLEKDIEGLRFGEENVGIKRHYAARAADTRIDYVIHVPQRKGIKPHQIAVVKDAQYDIDKVDHYSNTLPPITKLSLIELEKHRRKEFA